MLERGEPNIRVAMRIIQSGTPVGASTQLLVREKVKTY
jgi:hypothetical protein